MKTMYENRFNVDERHGTVAIYENTNFSYLVHWHNEIEIAWVAKGAMDLGINQEVQTLHEGDVCFCKSGDIHFYDSRNQESTVIVIILRNENLEFFYQWIEENPGLKRFMTKEQLKEAGLESIYQLLSNIQTEYRSELMGASQLIRAYVTELAVMVMRHWPSNLVKRKSSEHHDAKTEIIQDLLRYIDENISQALSMQELSRKYNLDLFYLSKLFNGVVGMPFKSYVNLVRIIHAEEKLESTQYPMIDIALDCGFNTLRNFNRVFKQIKKITPSNYRENFKRLEKH
jgi:AraC-like DNA-binding protein